MDLRHAVFLVYKVRIKFDHWRNTKDFVATNAFLYKFDMTQGYHHIDIDDNYQNYLGFSWKFDSKISYFMFIILPFSLSSAPFIFTKVMCCLGKNFGGRKG